MKTTVTDVTPELATQWLATNQQNRQPKLNRVSVYATAMREGRWRLTHQGIGFDRSGNLIDGQNRLMAVIEAGVMVRMQVTHGLMREDMMAVDMGAPRSAGDSLTILRGIERGKDRVAILRILFTAWKGISNYLADGQQIIEASDAHDASFAWFFGLPRHHALKYAPYAAALIYAYEARPHETDEFARLLAEPTHQAAGSPVLAMLTSMHQRSIRNPGGNGNMVRLRDFRIMCRAAMAYTLGEKMAKMQDTELGVKFFAPELQKMETSK
jgi:hypothetical protein